MRTQPIGLLATFGVCLALLLALSCGRGAGPCGLGGPYPDNVELFEKEVLPAKQRDFQTYESLELFLSQTSDFDEQLFEESVQANRNASANLTQQKYNYVITEEDCNILVAVWDEGVDLDPKTLGLGIACLGAGEKYPQPPSGTMIDWAPEEPYGRALATRPAPAPRSPCWLDPAQKDGFLDAISKHFMLAQESMAIGKGTIREYNKEWADTSVAYAGEILVDLIDCTYIVTEHSGTYLPHGK